MQDQSVEESNSLCNECEVKIKNAFDFKSFVISSDTSEPGVSEVKTENGDIPSTSTGETSAEKTTCHLCKKSVSVISVISLPKLLKDDSMMEVFQGHMPEMVSIQIFYWLCLFSFYQSYAVFYSEKLIKICKKFITQFGVDTKISIIFLWV